MLITKKQRRRLEVRLESRIFETMLQNPEMIREAICTGRTGLDEMSDEDLVIFAWDCWEMEVDE